MVINNAMRMLEILAQHYSLITRNQHHVQIRLDGTKYHNIWLIHRANGLKVQFYGQNGTRMFYNPDQLLSLLKKYDYKTESDLAKLIELDRLSSKIIKGKDGVYCDAGFKDGAAKLAVIRVFGNEIDLSVRHSENFATSIEAEIAALKFAIRKFPNAQIYFSDCKAAVEEINGFYISGEEIVQAIWINREYNTVADNYANLRKEG